MIFKHDAGESIVPMPPAKRPFSGEETETRASTPGATAQARSATLEDVLQVVLRFGLLLARSGATAFRVRNAMLRTAKALGVERAEFVVTPDTLCASVFSHQEFRTQVARIPDVGVNMNRLCRLEVLSRDLAALPGASTPAELTRELDEIEHAPLLYPRWITVLSLAAACAAFCGVIHGTPWQMVAAGIGAGAGHIMRLRLLARHRPLIALVVTSAFVACLGAYGATRGANLALAAAGSTPVSAGPAILASVLFLIPGVPIVNSLIDVINFDLTSGLARAAHASLIVACIAVGVLLFLAFTGFAVT